MIAEQKAGNDISRLDKNFLKICCFFKEKCRMGLDLESMMRVTIRLSSPISKISSPAKMCVIFL